MKIKDDNYLSTQSFSCRYKLSYFKHSRVQRFIDLSFTWIFLERNTSKNSFARDPVVDSSDPRAAHGPVLVLWHEIMVEFSL